MASALPVSLSGDNLGQRHRCLNSQVSQAAARGHLSFADLEHLPEQTPVDRLFKIDLAIKLNNIDYVLKNVKDEDMLYVSRALKCKWLVERCDVINPKYLEDVLFPEMVMPAISKMKHWLYINLTDPLTCQEFYQYYKTIKFDYAVKFLRHCDNVFLETEFPKILVQISPHYLKVFAEKCPRLVKVYYDAMATDNDLIKRYLQDEEIFYNSIKCVLKSEPDMFLDIMEKYHSLRFSKLSASATDYILRYHKSRVMAKAELYVVHFLHIPTVAQRLSVKECQEVVVKLARADYLSYWFSYVNVDTLVKRVSRDDRAAFKKRVFVEKDVGDRVAEWPYTLPTSPVLADASSGELLVFDDQEYEPIKMSQSYLLSGMVRQIGGCGDWRPRVKSELDKLFDEFRFIGFEGTFKELRRRVGAASSADRRRNMLLVLVSKSGGHADNVRALLQLAMRLRNEPVHERAAIVRSLVKRACAWRLPQDVWDTMLEYARGLGLDGTKPEAACLEGLHAVVLRQLLAAGDCEPAVRTAFLDCFSPLTEYDLTASERPKIVAALQRILLTAAADAEPWTAAKYLDKLLNVLEMYRVRLEPALSAVEALAERKPAAAGSLLVRLYNARVGRRELLRQYLYIRRDDAALVNALRHDPRAIDIEWLLNILPNYRTGISKYISRGWPQEPWKLQQSVGGRSTFLGSDQAIPRQARRTHLPTTSTPGQNTRVNLFFMKLAMYFNESGGIAEHVRQALRDKSAQEPRVKLARPLATLAGRDMESLWCEQDVAGGEHYKLAAALRANMHRARPAPDALALGWRKAGMKAVAWRAIRCPPARVTQLVQMLLEERVKRTVRLALALALQTDCTVEVFSSAAAIRPLAVLRAAIPYYREVGDAADPRVWEIIKPYLSTVDLKPRKGLKCTLTKVERIPNDIKAEYHAMLFLALDKISDLYAKFARRELMKCLPEVPEDLLESILLRVLGKIFNEDPESYPAIVIRYLMLSKSDDEEKSRYEKIGEPFFNKIKIFFIPRDPSSYRFFIENLKQIMTTLQYNYAFFDSKYQCCLTVVERVLTWIRNFLPKDTHFDKYVQIHATMLYFRAVRQSMQQKPEVFEDPAKMSKRVEVVGFTFGRYIVKEVAELRSQYFESVMELYRFPFGRYLNSYFTRGHSSIKFVSAVVKGMLSESIGSEARLVVHVISQYPYHLNYNADLDQIKELIMKNENKELQFFAHAEIFT